MPLLLLTKLSKIKGQRYVTHSGTFSRVPYHSSDCSIRQWTEAEKADASILDLRCLTSLWPLAVALPPMSHFDGSFGGNAEYTGVPDLCQSVGQN